MQLELDIPLRTIWGKYFCPNCGKEGLPRRILRCEEGITFWNCSKCNFSTWDLKEYEKHKK